jgi:hypothetical protein
VLWTISNFINGKLNLEQDLKEEEWRNATYDVVHFVLQDDFLEEILQFDAETFFTVISKVF